MPQVTEAGRKVRKDGIHWANKNNIGKIQARLVKPSTEIHRGRLCQSEIREGHWAILKRMLNLSGTSVHKHKRLEERCADAWTIRFRIAKSDSKEEK